MPKEDMRKLVRWFAYVYAPMALLIVGVLVLVEYRAHQLAKQNVEVTPPSSVSGK